MEILQVSALLIIFLVFSGLMFLRKIPALLALPMMAFLIPLVSGVAIQDIIQYVIGMGSTRLAEAYTIALFGSMLSIMMQKTGVAESFIKSGAELAGDKPVAITIIMLLFIALLFTTLGGLGAIIMVATVVLPILASVGVGPVTTAGVFLMGLSIGGTLNVGNWAVYTGVLKLPVEQVRAFALTMFFVAFVMAVVYIIVQLYKDGVDVNFKKIGIAAGVLLLDGIATYFFGNQILNIAGNWLGGIWEGTKLVLTYAGYAFTAYLIFDLLRYHTGKNKTGIFWGAYFIPVVPLVLILFFKVNFIAAFICGLMYGFVTTYNKQSLNILVRSILDGGAVVMPAVALMLGIGMLLNAVMGPAGALPEAFKLQYQAGWPVITLLQPLLKSVIPSGALQYVLFFTLLAPLALYRGPLNVWGMGYGLAALFLASNMHPGAIMGALMAVGQIQGISDPTNTQNVWLANEMRIDVQKILWNTLPYTWIAALAGLTIAAIYFL